MSELYETLFKYQINIAYPHRGSLANGRRLLCGLANSLDTA